jgi:transposase, IS5 family
MVKLQEAENQIVTDYEVYDQRPSDSDLLIGAVEIHQARLGRTPRLVAADAAFYSAKNETTAKAKGVKRFCVPNRSTKSAERKREQKKRWFRNGQKWRTGCEGRISVVKRRHGLSRCRYQGEAGMERWVGLGIVRQSPQHRSCIGKAVRSVDHPPAISGTHHNIPPATPGGIRFTARH